MVMSVTIFKYKIEFVALGTIISSKNYNSLVSAIRALIGLFLVHFEQIMVALNNPELNQAYEEYKNKVDSFKQRLEQGLYAARRETLVCAHHHFDLKEILLSTAIALQTLFVYMENAEMPIPNEAKAKVKEAYSILVKYPELVEWMIIQPEDHNLLLKALNNIYEAMILAGLICGKYDETNHGECFYC